MKQVRVVEGEYQINRLLDEGWKLESVTPHSQRRERYMMGTRLDDDTTFWIVAVLTKDGEEALKS